MAHRRASDAYFNLQYADQDPAVKKAHPVSEGALSLRPINHVVHRRLHVGFGRGCGLLAVAGTGVLKLIQTQNMPAEMRATKGWKFRRGWVRLGHHENTQINRR